MNRNSMTKVSLREINERILLKVVAWVSIILFGLGLFFALMGIIQMEILTNSMTGLFENDLRGNGHFQGFSEMRLIARLIYFVFFTISLFGLAAGIGILKLQDWGKILFTILAISAAIILIGGVLYFNIKLKDYLAGGLIDVAIKIQFITYQIFLLFIAWILIRVSIKINSKRFKRHFSRELGW